MSNNAYILVFHSIENVYKNLEILFAKSIDKDLEQPSVCYVGPLKHIKGIKIGIQSFNIKNIKTV